MGVASRPVECYVSGMERKLNPSLFPPGSTATVPTGPNHPEGYVAPQPTEVLPLWPGEPPHLIADGRPEHVINERYRDVSIPQLFVYLPEKAKATGTSLIICAGGGYKHLALCIHVDNVVKELNEQGIAVFGLKYRTRYGSNDVVADALADGQRAVRLVRSRAEQWHLDPHRIGVQGYSAGGHLCLNLAARVDEGQADASDPLDRLSARPDFCVLMCPWPNNQTAAEYPLGRNTPPTWIASARDDTSAPFAFASDLAQRLASLDVPHELFAVETGGHAAFHYGMSCPPGGQWPAPLLSWMERIGMYARPRGR